MILIIMYLKIIFVIARREMKCSAKLHLYLQFGIHKNFEFRVLQTSANLWINGLFQKLICDRLYSIDGIRWSPNDELLCIWCSSPAEPKLIIYSSALEKHVAAFSPLETAQPSDARNYRKELRGIENVEWIPSGQLLAVIGFNEVVI